MDCMGDDGVAEEKIWGEDDTAGLTLAASPVALSTRTLTSCVKSPSVSKTNPTGVMGEAKEKCRR